MTLPEPTILVVEDEPLIRMVLSDALAEQGYCVLEAGCVLEAAAILGHTEIDGLVTDIDLPGGLSGIDLAWLVARTCNRVGIVVASGGHIPTGGELPLKALFFAKPYRLEDILSAVAKTVRPSGFKAIQIAI